MVQYFRNKNIVIFIKNPKSRLSFIDARFTSILPCSFFPIFDSQNNLSLQKAVKVDEKVSFGLFSFFDFCSFARNSKYLTRSTNYPPTHTLVNCFPKFGHKNYSNKLVLESTVPCLHKTHNLNFKNNNINSNFCDYKIMRR